MRLDCARVHKLGRQRCRPTRHPSPPVKVAPPVKLRARHRRTIADSVAIRQTLGRGMDFALVVLVFLGIGYGLDRWLGTRPLFMIGLVVFAVVGQFIKMYYDYNAAMERARGRARRAGPRPKSRRRRVGARRAHERQPPDRPPRCPGPRPRWRSPRTWCKRGLIVAPAAHRDLRASSGACDGAYSSARTASPSCS